MTAVNVCCRAWGVDLERRPRWALSGQQQLLQSPRFSTTEAMLEEAQTLRDVGNKFKPDIIVHLAAQAGVRYSIENPRAYIDSNIIGTFNVMELARELSVSHLLKASTSSVYGANEEMPFTELQKADAQLSFYAATKKANEAWRTPTCISGTY